MVEQRDLSQMNQIAPIQDRILAFFFDLILFNSVFTLLLSELIKRIEFQYIMDPDSFSLVVFVGVGAFCGSLLWILFQALCGHYLGASPGKIFLKMRLVSIRTGGPITISQGLLRSFLWLLEFLLLGIPFLETLSHPERRPIHDRAADTLLITLKVESPQKNYVSPFKPHPLEAHFIKNVIMTLIIFLLFWGSWTISKIYTMANNGDFSKMREDRNQILCNTDPLPFDGDSLSQTQKFDHLLALYLAKIIPAACLDSMAESLFWTPSDEPKDWAYLIKAFLYQNETKKFNQYLEKTCQTNPDSEACQVAALTLKMGVQDQEPLHSTSQIKSQSELVLIWKNLMLHGKYELAKPLLESLKVIEGLAPFVQREQIKLFWQQGHFEKALGAYENTLLSLDDQDRMSISSWLCLEELHKKCEVPLSSCNYLVKSMYSSTEENWTLPTALSFHNYQQCQQEKGVTESGNQLGLIGLSLNEYLLKNPLLKDYVRASDLSFDLSLKERVSLLKKVVLQKNTDSNPENAALLQGEAVRKWISLSQEERDFKEIAQWLNDPKRSSLYPISQSKQYLSQLKKKNSHLKDLSQDSQRLPASLKQKGKEENSEAKNQ